MQLVQKNLILQALLNRYDESIVEVDRVAEEKYNVLVLGTGGREHAIIKKISESQLLGDLYTNSSNKIWHEHAKYMQLESCEESFVDLTYKCKKAKVDIVVVGQEKYLAAGISEVLAEENIKTFGPNKSAARLESLKSFTRELCSIHNIPSPNYWHFVDLDNALSFVEAYPQFPLVVKADGLAAGKGVMICPDRESARNAVETVFSGRLDLRGKSVVIEEFLKGEELSFFAFVDGRNIVPFGSAYDYKQIVQNKRLVNTGGMGSYSCPSAANAEKSLERSIMRNIIYPTINALYAMKINYIGILFAGIMVHDGQPKLLEYNVRFGDPETQCMLPRLESDLLQIIVRTVEGNLSCDEVQLSNKACVCVVMANQGYPGPCENSTAINNLEAARQIPGVEILHAGTEVREGQVFAAGGRVINVVATADTLSAARSNAYSAVSRIDWPEGFYIHNIGELSAEGAH